MKYAEDFRKIARDALRGKWGIAVIAGIIAALLGGTDRYFSICSDLFVFGQCGGNRTFSFPSFFGGSGAYRY